MRKAYLGIMEGVVAAVIWAEDAPTAERLCGVVPWPVGKRVEVRMATKKELKELGIE